MIDEIRPHREVDERVDANRAEVLGGTDSRQHEEPRRVEGSGAQHHLTAFDPRNRTAAGRRGLDPRDRPVSIDEQPLGDRVGDHRQVRPLSDGSDESLEGVVAATVLDC